MVTMTDDFREVIGGKVFIESDRISAKRFVFVVGVIGDPHSWITETTLGAARNAAKRMVSAIA